MECGEYNEECKRVKGGGFIVEGGLNVNCEGLSVECVLESVYWKGWNVNHVLFLLVVFVVGCCCWLLLLGCCCWLLLLVVVVSSMHGVT